VEREESLIEDSKREANEAIEKDRKKTQEEIKTEQGKQEDWSKKANTDMEGTQTANDRRKKADDDTEVVTTAAKASEEAHKVVLCNY